MSVSEFPIPNKNKDRRGTRREMREMRGQSQGQARGQSRGERFDEDRWSPRLRLLMVVLSSLVLWSGIFLVASWIY